MTIAILAHDSRKELALQFCTAYSGILSRNTVIATGTTGRMLAQATGLPVHCYLSGRLGGIQQIAARVACDEVDLVLFFRDPLKQETGSTLIDYINTQRVIRAAQLLVQNNHTIAAVAEEVGILDVNYFTKIFKKTLGVTPTRYRREHKEK